MSDVLIVTRWVRFGHDRLYVKAADGTQVGYRDNKTGIEHLESGANLDTLRTGLAAYWARGGRPAPEAAPGAPVNGLTAAVPSSGEFQPHPPAAVPSASALLVAPEQPWTDLSLRRPGTAARDQALAKRSEAPVKTLFARVLGVPTDERAWRIGADGEELVAAQLSKLGPAWKALHAVPVGNRGSDIDHVLIGPGGVYTVNAKHHPGANVWAGGNTVMVNGSKTWYVRNSRHEAGRAAELLSARAGFPVHVTGLIAIIGDRDKVTVKSQPPGGEVFVLPRRQVADWLSQRGPVLGPEQVAALFEVARRSTTWMR